MHWRDPLIWTYVKLHTAAVDKLRIPMYNVALGEEPDPALYPEWSKGNFWYEMCNGRYWPVDITSNPGSGLPVPIRILRDYPSAVARLATRPTAIQMGDMYTVLTTYGILRYLTLKALAQANKGITR